MNRSEDSADGDRNSDALNRVFGALHRINRMFASVTDLDELLGLIVEISENAVQAEASALLLYDPERNDLYFRVARGIRGDQDRLKRELRMPLGDGIAGHAAETRCAVNVADARQDDRFYPFADEISGVETRSLVAVPMIGHNQLVGVIEVLNKRDGVRFTDIDVETLEIFAQQAALAIQDACLVEANVQAERLAAVGAAVSGLSHHAKNVLAGLSASCELIDYAIDNNQSGVIAEGWRIHKRAIARLSALVADMLVFGRIRRGAAVRRTCSVAELIEDIVVEQGPLLKQKGIESGVRLETMPEMFVDRDALRHVLINFINNAIDAVPEGKGHISVTLHRTRGASGACIEVTDNGPGIPKDMLTRVFEPFFTTKGSRGSGLGLAVVKKIVDEQGWLLDIKPAEPQGSTFRLEIPDAFVINRKENGVGNQTQEKSPASRETP